MSRLALIALSTLLALALLGAAATAQMITLASDGSLVPPYTPIVVHVNMTQAVTVTASATSPVFVVLNITIPPGFEVLWVNVTYNTTAATPVAIKWDAATRNMTVNVSVTSTPYNDLNVTLVLYPVSTSASGLIKATYYYNQSTTYTVLASDTASLAVNASAAPVMPSYVTLNYPKLMLLVPGPAAAAAAAQLLNEQQLSYINSTLINGAVVCLAANQTMVAAVSPLSLTVPETIRAQFGSTTTSATPRGICISALPVAALTAPTSGNFTAVALYRVTGLASATVNATYAYMLETIGSEVHLNVSDLAVVYGSSVSELYVNATADNAEAHILSSNVTTTLALVNATGVTGAKAYALLSNIAATTFTADTGWQTLDLIASYAPNAPATAATASVYGSSGLVSLLPYGTPSAAYAHVALSLPPTTLTEYYAMPVDLTPWLQGSVAVLELSDVLVRADMANSLKAMLYAITPSSLVAAETETLNCGITNPLIVNVSIGATEVMKAYTASTTVTLTAAIPLQLYLCAPKTTATPEVKAVGIGNEVVVFEYDVGPSILLADHFYNATITINSTKVLVLGALLNMTGARVVYYSVPPIEIHTFRAYATSAGTEINVTYYVFPPYPPTSSALVYGGLKLYVFALLPGTGEAYSAGVKVYELRSLLEPVEPSTATATTTSVTGNYAVISSKEALLAYALLLNQTYSITPFGLTTYAIAFAGNNTLAGKLPGEIMLAEDIVAPNIVINATLPTAGNMLCIAGYGGMKKLVVKEIAASIPYSVFCLKDLNVTAITIEANATVVKTANISAVKICSSVIDAGLLAVNATTLMIKGSDVTAGLVVAMPATSVGVMVGGKLTGSIDVKSGTLDIFYANLSGVTAATGSIKVFLPVAYSTAVQGYIAEPLVVKPLYYNVVNATGLTTVKVTVPGGIVVEAVYTTAPTTPTYVVAAQLPPSGTTKPPIPSIPGSVSVADVAVAGAAPSEIRVYMPLSPSICASEKAEKIISSTIAYYYDFATGTWVKAKPAEVLYDAPTCHVVLVFNATSTPSVTSFTGLPVASYTPYPMVVVGVKVYSLAGALASLAAVRIVYAALAALLAAVVAAYLAAWRRM